MREETVYRISIQFKQPALSALLTAPSSYQARQGLTVVRLSASILYRVDVTGIIASVSPLAYTKNGRQVQLTITEGNENVCWLS